jgi:hypothetical protein
MKRSLAVILGLVLAIGVLLGGIYFRGRATKPEPGSDASNGTAGKLPASQGGSGSGSATTTGAGDLPAGATSLNIADVVEYAVASSGDILAVKSDGRVILSSSTDTVVGSQKVAGMLDARFSYDGRRLLVKAGDALSPRWSVYDVKKNSWRQLPVDSRDAAWAPSDYRIAYVSQKAAGVTITLLDLGNDRSAPKALFNLNAEDLILSWTSGSRLLIEERPSATVKGSAWIYDLQKNSLSPFAETKGLMTYFEDGQGLTFEAGNGSHGGFLSFIKDDGSGSQKLSFLTLPDKCVFYRNTATTTALSAQKKLLCAVPRDSRAFQTASLPDDYYMRAILTADDFYSIDLSDGTFAFIKNGQTASFDAYRLKVVGGKVYFLNRADSHLYSLSLN